MVLKVASDASVAGQIFRKRGGVGGVGKRWSGGGVEVR
jgi:hypothetical protein